MSALENCAYYSINQTYLGTTPCEHGCSYSYAYPTIEMTCATSSPSLCGFYTDAGYSGKIYCPNGCSSVHEPTLSQTCAPYYPSFCYHFGSNRNYISTTYCLNGCSILYQYPLLNQTCAQTRFKGSK